MKPYRALALISLAWLACRAPATAEPSLQEMLVAASSCSDVSLKDAASRTCDPPEQIASMAVGKCQDKWKALANKAIGPPPADASGKVSHTRSLKIYAEAMEYEYIRIAELKAIDIRTAAGKCGFD